MYAHIDANEHVLPWEALGCLVEIPQVQGKVLSPPFPPEPSPPLRALSPPLWVLVQVLVQALGPVPPWAPLLHSYLTQNSNKSLLQLAKVP